MRREGEKGEGRGEGEEVGREGKEKDIIGHHSISLPYQPTM